MQDRHCAATARLNDPADSIRITLAFLAPRWSTLKYEVFDLHEHIETLVKPLDHNSFNRAESESAQQQISQRLR
ncbi:hypothetical protein GOALK_026_01110 [Gordonia alkanivorans NBRC 16433]|uniref:Uncharacterized protein n=1 Tax=Gordonia alkanivorans NBRC 16433 TaxID=1027371 RepID=F9VRR5_9ACTN|nr:hypothetical protein GOALK_026_01110 [Gordonia alkanivorans NBRC 16433]